jgi:PhnB protein
MMTYEDAEAAISFLERAFGFVENRTARHTDGGRVSHAELTLDGGAIMLANGSDDYRSPKRHAAECELTQRALDTPYIVDGLLVYVDDVRAHFARASAAGADVLSPVEEGGPGTRYRVADCEGHRWMFMQASTTM